MDELYKVDDEWEWYIGKLFSRLIENNFANELNTIVEFAPGYRYKIANALKELNFKGTIYVIDYNENVLKYISLKYKEILPKANIICINKDLDESIEYLPKNIDLFLSNHSLDDMIISEYLTKEEKIEIFNNGDESKSKLLKKWEDLSTNSLNLERIKNIVFVKWVTFFENLNIDKVMMSQYKSNDYYIKQNNYMDDITRDLFLKIKELVPTKDDYIDYLLNFCFKENDERFKDVKLLSNTQAAKNWIVGSYTRSKINIPNSVFLMGKQIFMNARLYSRKEKLKPIYINKQLYEKIFSKSFNFEEASELISNCFSVTIDQNKGDEKSFINMAFIDFQSDNSDISLNGNKGSGRAYYFDKNYNLKGELTPLATSSNPEYNNGKLSLVSAIHESMISNVLNDDMIPSSFQTLAVFDSNEEYSFVVEGKSAPCGVMIRVSNDSDLYRVSHRFAGKSPFKRDELVRLASNFGVLEGNKFIDRFLHGAWSSGNISIEGNMIDFDTSFFTIGRHPQCSYTNKYKTNYFGYEYLGQEMVLDSIVNSSLNIDNVEIAELEKILLDKKNEQISMRLFELMGFKEELYPKYKKEMNKLSKKFEFLSRKTFANYALFNVVAPDCINCYIFNFSRLFRYYQLLKNNQNSSLIDYFELLLNKNANLISFPIEKDLEKKIHEYFKDILVNDNLEYTKLLNEAIEFIKEFDNFNEKVINEMILM